MRVNEIHTDLINNGNIWKEWAAQRDTWNETLNTIRQWLQEFQNIKLIFN